MKNKDREFTTTTIILKGFAITIVIGTLLLMLPISNTAFEWTNFYDAFFTATSSTCVTGLVTLPTYSYWSVFGKIVILLLIEIGGLGFVSFMIIFLVVISKRISLRDRLVIQDAFNLNSTSGLVSMIKKIISCSITVQFIGSLLYMIVFIPEFGFKGIFISFFNSISAFCNAGIDIVGNNSLENYINNPIINLTTITLIVLGGIGFPIWWIVIDSLKTKKQHRWNYIKMLDLFPMYAKVVLVTTIILIVLPTIIIFIVESLDDNVLSSLPLGDKIFASLFQSITTRTAGFYTIPQEKLSLSTCLLCIVLMFIGGSPSGTAGGIKTTTIAVLLMTVKSIIQGRNNTELFYRRVSNDIIRKSIAIFFTSLTIMLVSFWLVTITQEGLFIDMFYEVASAIGTVGLSRNYTQSLNDIGKIIISFTMYLGRVGPISIALLFNGNKIENLITYPSEDIRVG